MGHSVPSTLVKVLKQNKVLLERKGTKTEAGMVIIKQNKLKVEGEAGKELLLLLLQ